MVQDIRLADSVPQQIKMLNDKIERLARKPQMLGCLGSSVPTTQGSCTVAETIQAETVTCNIVSGRRYRITHNHQWTIDTGTPTGQTYRFRVQIGSSVTTGGTIIREMNGPIPVASWSSGARVVTWVATFTGQATFGIGWFVNNSATGKSEANSRELIVEDIGI